MTLMERDRHAPQAWRGEMPVTSRYTFGLGGERFFRALKDEGQILGARCEECDITYVPGRAFCERCMAELDDWFDVGAFGEVETFTFVFEDLDGNGLEEPEIVAFVRIADGGLIHRLGEIDLEDVEIGMPVEAVLKPESEREGGIEDIVFFRPIG